MSTKIRPIRVEGNIAYVTLTRGKEATIDACDVHLVEGRSWQSLPAPNTVYASSSGRFLGKRTTTLMHRLIAGAVTGDIVDHKDGNGLNNRRYNLRKATHGQNMQNSKPRSNSKSGFKGVRWDKVKAKWTSSIAHNGRRNWLGYFETADEAHDAYCKASIMLHGEFGRIK